MSTMSGADPDLLDQLARELTGSAQQLRAVQARLTARVQQAPWAGRDADRVRAEWAARHVRAVTTAAVELEQAATAVTSNATDQRRASAATGALAGALAGAVGGSIGAAPAGSAGAPAASGPAAMPTPGSIPQAVAAWWSGLTPAEQAALIRDHPDQLGNLDGVPSAARDLANRERLPQLTATLQAQLDTLDGQQPPQYADFSEGIPNPAWLDWQQQTADLRRRLDGLHALGSTLDGGRPLDPPLLLIGLQDTGNGQAIVSRGNPDTAAHVATLVPGITTTRSGIQGGVDRSNSLFDAAQAAGSGSTATVTWYGYDAPQGVDALSEDAAKAGALQLDAFQSGLRATHQGAPSVNTVIAHSYGGDVVGFAAAPGLSLDADNVVYVGATGHGPVLRADALSLTGIPQDQNGSHVYATIDPYDPANRAGLLNGVLPSDPGFGAHVFSSNGGHPSALGTYDIAAHSSYWDQGNVSLDNFGKVIAGHGDQTR